VLDYDYIKSIANQNIESILTKLGIEYCMENGWITMRCIFHHGQDFNLKFRGDSFYCFSQCRKQYSIIDIVRQAKQLSFDGAVHWLADFLGIDIENIVINEQQIQINQYLKTINKLVSLKKHKQIYYKPIDGYVLDGIVNKIHPSLLENGFTKEVCEHFGIGYGTSGVMEGRITFPIDAPNGEIISISGRMPKYEEIGVSKYYIVGHSQVKNTLWNYSRIKDDLWMYQNIIVVEGFKSVMMLYQNGYENAVSTIGASISKEQKNLLLKMGLPVIVICDNDRVGEKFGQSIFNQCSYFTSVEVIKLSDITNKEKASVDDLNESEWNKLNLMLGGKQK
jgi:DNA primase